MEVDNVNITMVENGYIVSVTYKDTLAEKTFVAKDLDDLNNLFIKWGFTSYHQSKKSLLNELNPLEEEMFNNAVRHG